MVRGNVQIMVSYTWSETGEMSYSSGIQNLPSPRQNAINTNSIFSLFQATIMHES
jgi:hypothetical protein